MIRRIDDARNVFRLEGYTPPAEVENLFAMFDAITDRVATLPTVDYRELAANPKTAANKFTDRVQQYLIGQQMNIEVNTGLDMYVRTEATRLVRREANVILAALRPRFDTAAQIMNSARAAGISNSTDGAVVIDLGDDAVALYRQLPDARRQLDGIAMHVGALVNAGGYPDHYSATHDIRQRRGSRFLRRIDGPETAVFGGLPPTGPGGMWLDLVPVGLQLNTIEQSCALLDAVTGYFDAEDPNGFANLAGVPVRPASRGDGPATGRVLLG